MTKTTITLSTAQNLLLPSASMRIGYIQNNGSADARLTFDGSDPATGLGFLLPAGQQLWLPQAYGSNMVGSPAPWKPIRGFCATSTSIDVGTDDSAST